MRLTANALQARDLERDNFRLRVLLTSARNQATQAVSRAETAERALENLATSSLGPMVETRDMLAAWSWARWALSVAVVLCAGWAGSGFWPAALVPVVALAGMFPMNERWSA